MNEKIIVDFIKEKDNKDVVVLNRLMGGMSNYSYVFCMDDKKYTFRIPGKGSEHFTNRVDEIEIMNIIDKYDFLPKPIYNDIKTGYKIAPYVEGKVLSECVEKPLEEIAKILKKLHGIEKFPNDYEHLKRLQYYESINDEIDPVYVDLKEKWLKIYDEILVHVELCPCHGDSQMSNFVVDNERVYLLDWEFSANNDPLYDIACFGNNNFEDAKDLIKVYFETVGKNEYQRLYAWRMFQCLQWHNVARYKEKIGLSEELKVNFKGVANAYLEKAQGFFENYLEVSEK